MSNPEDPKKAPNAPAESPTQAFKLKVGGWLDEIKQDFDLPPDPAAPAAEKDRKPPVPPAPPPPPRRR